MMGGASVRAAVAAGDAKGAHSDGGHCCPSDRLMNRPSIIAIVMAVHNVEAARGTGTADWLLPVLRLFIPSVSLSHFHSFFYPLCSIYILSFFNFSLLLPFSVSCPSVSHQPNSKIVLQHKQMPSDKM